MENVEVSFITINYNSSNYTKSLLNSILLNTKGASYEVIVVDNASSEEDFKNLSAQCFWSESVKLIRSPINLGFAGGNMFGVSVAKGRYYFFINNDCELLNDAASIFKEFLTTHSTAALVTGSVLDKENRASSSYKQFPHIAKQLFGNSVQRLFSKRKFPSNKVKLEHPAQVEVISGSCMFFDAKVFCEIGGFDTVFFLYCEEEDISKRVWDQGGQVYFVPSARIFHASGGSSSQETSLEKEYYISYFHLLDKHYGKLGRGLLKLALFFKLLFRVFKRRSGLSIFASMLGGFAKKDSLRYKQVIKKDCF
ncbi:glycosyltransferase family 2 protein [Vreelandella aquamarina]|uniref:glycosyltransferase family 2 protein n=1 Tax=Vreelandella aquamarina TaxID=77097 RepID=UPI00384D825B